MANCFLNSRWDLYHFFCRPVLAIGGTWFGLTDSRMYKFKMAKSKKNQNIRMYHLDLDLRVHVYALCIWSAKSTPPMFWFYSLTERGQLKSAWLPSDSLRVTTVVSVVSHMVSTKATGFLSLQIKQWTLSSITCLAMCSPLFNALTWALLYFGNSFPIGPQYLHNRFCNPITQLKVWD